MSNRSERAYFWGAGALICAALLAYSQTHAFGWDEGYHLLAAQLIRAGKTPYLDFCFPQTPITAYWNAAWMSVFGESWRTVHAVAALCTSAAVMLSAGFVLTRFPVPAWSMAGAITVAFLIAANTAVVQFATAGQPYGLCLLLVVAAFRCAVLAAERSGPLLAGSAGLLSGAAAAGSLLTAPVAPVLLAWLLFSDRAGNRRVKLTYFLAGIVVSWLPVLWLFLQGPRQVFFNVIEYMLLYRRTQYEGTLPHDLEVLMSLFESPQGLLLALLAAAGLLCGAGYASGRRWRAELLLCFLLAAALALHVSWARPTFPQYYMFAVPFLAILASAGLYEAGLRLGSRKQPWWGVIMVAGLMCGGLASRLYRESRYDFFWRDMEAVARQVDAVTPRNATLLASEEHVYFLTRRAPSAGMEVEDSHGIPAPPADAALLHLVPRQELYGKIEAGVFDTVEICEEDQERVQALGLERIYGRSAVIPPCTVFWESRSKRARAWPK